MKQVKVLGTKKEEKGSVTLPKQFQEPIRKDLIQRGYLTVRANSRQPYGAKLGAGMRHSAEVSRRRRKYRGSYGMGISRVPRKIISRRGTRMNWIAAIMPGVVGGRRAHPPKASKIWSQKINVKERRKAIRSAMSANMDASLVKERGHKVPDGYPFALDNSWEALTKVKEVIAGMKQLGLKDELERSSIKKVRAGKGKMRGRKYKKRTGVLFVVSEKCKLAASADNIPGIDIVTVNSLNANVLAPGGMPGRLTLYTQKAIEQVKEKGLYI